MQINSVFSPAILGALREYSFHRFLKDLVAGIVVAVVALPLAIAFGIASGVSPVQGLTTAVIAGFLISAFSGSRFQIGGPTGAFIVIIYGIIQQYGYPGLAIATIMAGVILVTMGAFGLGTIIKFIPYPVTVGFTSGIALIIFTGQLKDVFGLQIAKLPADFFEKMGSYFHNYHTVNPWAFLISAFTILVCIYWKRITAKVPGSLIAIVVSTAAVQLLGIPVETIGMRFPDVAGGMRIPTPSIPIIKFSEIQALVSPAISIALLAGIESLLSAVVADGMTGRRHHSNTELIAQGIANIFSPLFGGIPATGAIARTATNIKTGAFCNISGIVHAVLLFGVMLFLGKWAAMIPMATLGGIVTIVAWNMSEIKAFRRVLTSTRSDAFVLIVTFLLTVIVDLTVAIQAGLLLAAVLFIKKMSEAINVTKMLEDDSDPDRDNDPLDIRLREVPPNVDVFEIQGALFFGAVDKFREAIAVTGHRRILILRMRHVLTLDATALHTLEEIFTESVRSGVTLILSGVHSQPLVVMQKTGFLDKVGLNNVFTHIDDALARAKELTR